MSYTSKILFVSVSALLFTPAAAQAAGTESGPGVAASANPAPTVASTAVPASKAASTIPAVLTTIPTVYEPASVSPVVAPSSTVLQLAISPSSATAAITKPTTSANIVSPTSLAPSSVYASTGVVAPTEQSKFDQGKIAIGKKDWVAAAILFRAVVSENPSNADAWNFLGYSTRKGGDPKASIALYNRALKINPKHLGALEYQGEAFVQLKKLPQAKKNLAKLKTICGVTCGEYQDLAKMTAGASR